MVKYRRYIFYLQRMIILLRAGTKNKTKKRAGVVLTAFLLFAVYLLYNVFRLDYVLYDYYKDKTYSQVTTSSPLRAKRGNIYDSNMNLLATSNTVYRVFVSTKDIKTKSKKDGKDYAKIISDGLSGILSLSAEALYEKISSSSVLDVTLKAAASEEEYEALLDFISKNSLERLVFTEAQSSRYYPLGTLAAHTLGFTGSDNQGLYGLEYQYDDILSGNDGYYVYAKDAGGNALDTEYSAYYPAEDGYSLVTTIDSYIQSELEAVIENVRVNHNVQNRVTGIVMDTNTGAILAMATTTPFNPNSPFTLDEVSAEKLAASGFAEGSEEYKNYKLELMQVRWSNKAVRETYEPGSTFKIVTVSAALDTGVASPSDTFSCNGYREVGGWRIKCHKVTGHGSGFSLAYGLQMSCNPCMIALSERLGPSAFYSYVEKFGYLEKTGIDLPSEASSIFHKEEALGPTELATASFGQRFKVTIINQLTAISAVANGGKLVTPYVVQKIIDSEGNTVSEHTPVIRREVVSEEVAKTVSNILIDGVNGDGGAKNAGVVGYDVAAKTGTSQKFDVLDENGNSYLRVGSTVAYALDGERGVSVIIVVDEPTSQVKYGSVVAAPYVSELLEKTLPYLEYNEKNEKINVTVGNYVGMNIDSAKESLKADGIHYEVIGNGSVVLSQTPSANDTVTLPLSKVILYTERDTESETVTVPTLIGLNIAEAIRRAVSSGFNIRLLGGTGVAVDRNDIVTEQSLPPGETKKRGTVITLRAVTTEFED